MTVHQASANTMAQITARMDRLPAKSNLWMLVILISLGAFFEIYDLVFTGYIAPGMTKSGLFQTTTSNFFGLHGIAAFIAATFAGLFIGTFGLGFLPDKYGRRLIFTVSLLWYSVGSAIMALQTSTEAVLFWRLITGIGVGIELVTVDVYITELVPQHMRGRAISLNQTIMFLGAPIAAILSYWLIPIQLFGLDGWRWVVLFGSAGAVFVWVIRLGVPESPRWLAEKGRVAEADAIVSHIEARVYRNQPPPPPPALPPLPKQNPPTASFLELWQAPYRKRVLMLSVFNFFQAIGFYGFNNWVPTLLAGQGMNIAKSLLYSSVIAIASPLGPLLAMTISDKIERKWLIVYAATAIIVFGLLFAQTKIAAELIVLGVVISLASSTMSVAYHAYQAELFPTRVRSRATGFVYSFSRLGAGFSGFIIAFFLRDFGITGVFFAISGAMLIVVLSIGVFGPKTKGKRLEEISQ